MTEIVGLSRPHGTIERYYDHQAFSVIPNHRNVFTIRPLKHVHADGLAMVVTYKGLFTGFLYNNFSDR